MVKLYVIDRLEVIKYDQELWLSFGSIPVYTHGVLCCLRAWKLVFVGTLMLSDKGAEESVDYYVG